MSKRKERELLRLIVGHPKFLSRKVLAELKASQQFLCCRVPRDTELLTREITYEYVAPHWGPTELPEMTIPFPVLFSQLSVSDATTYPRFSTPAPSAPPIPQGLPCPALSKIQKLPCLCPPFYVLNPMLRCRVKCLICSVLSSASDNPMM